MQVQPVVKPVGCLFTQCSRLSNRLCRVNGVLRFSGRFKDRFWQDENMFTNAAEKKGNRWV